MKKITLLVLLLWLPNLVFTWSEDAHFFYWRHQFILLSGMLGLVYMALAMLLAIRLPKVENYVHGQDKAYGIHKWLGIRAGITLVIHWLLIEIPHWLIRFNLLERPQRRAQFAQSLDLINWTHLAKTIGELSFYCLTAVIAISLIQSISYRKFRFTHKLAGALFLAGAFHSIILLDNQPSALGMNLLVWGAALLGSICAFISLSGQIGKRRKVQGQVSYLKHINEPQSQYRVLHIGITLDTPMAYTAGQFAYLDFLDGEPAHPFSVLKYDVFSQQVEFAIKDLGDYTHQLYHSLTFGQPVSVEGGYGRFCLPQATHQVWIGAGIGIVPFIAWIQALSQKASNSNHQIDLYYCRETRQQTAFVELIQTMIAPLHNIQLHIYTAGNHEYLSAKEITQGRDLSELSISFCGPMAFSQSMKNALIDAGLAPNNFHSERFMMR
ncbi:ferredoxin reductase family protein [Vibrio cincinnatiensis]|uniref:ferredoxin reductase family protein n=1 Tax=Vibrio cincinnatiensis TaxID=675 RepID=UPI001EDE61C6|nr:ferric reductase-like transmembrane domain-containing protein [Vibrio cincinnatiensis]MCG3733512.1 iron reductase [Vibrio cincinnatiensis]